MSFRGGAHSFHIARDGTFFNIQGDHVTNIHQQQPLDPTKILDNTRATEATHKSSTADYAPKCNPKTRKKVIGSIMELVVTAFPKSILWFDGPAGAGKTCIMREVVVCCEATPGIAAVSYFFSTSVGELTHARPFIATIAHQLAYSGVPGLKPAILQAVYDNPTIFRDGLESQMEALITKPLQVCGFGIPSFAPRRRVVIVVDGLDECRKVREREHLLGLLLVLVKKLPLSLTVIIASRPELDIRTAFAHEDFKATTHVIRLHDYDGKDDVRIFYCDEFEKICQTHHLRRYIPIGWITEEILHVLITKSSGHFIYPSVIMKYITNHPRRNPVELLEEAMATSPKPGADNPLAELDALYTLILHPPEVDFPLMRRILHFLIVMTTSPLATNTCYAEPAFLDEFLRLPPGTVEGSLCDLHSILRMPPPPPNSEYQPIRIHHKSLQDFLLSSHRSKDLFRMPYETHVDIALARIDHLQSWKEDPKISQDSRMPVRYAIQPWMTIMQGFLKASPTPSLPDAILAFDPRCIWEFLFVEEGLKSIDNRMKSIYSEFHTSYCAGRPESECSPLCKALLQMGDCEERLLSFTDGFWDRISRAGGKDYQRKSERIMKGLRLDRLKLFKFETNIYEGEPEPDASVTGSPSPTIYNCLDRACKRARPALR